MASPLAPFFHARSVAIVGGSDDPTRIGGRPIRYLLENGYPGEIWPVNPNRTEVQGLRAVATVGALPDGVDLAVIAVGRERVVDIVKACGARGIGSAIVFAAGYAETGDDGRRDQETLARTAADAGVRLLGPNSNGAICPPSLAPFALTPVLGEGLPAGGTLAVATQSAAVGTYWLRRIRERSLGLRYWAHTGNEADLGLSDVMAFFLDDPDVRTILCVLEQWRHPADLAAILDRIRTCGKTVIFLPLGTTEIGRRAAISHTGSLLARTNDVVMGLVRQAGALIVHGLEEAIGVAATVDLVPRVGGRVGILTPSGGLGVLLADAFASAGFTIPTFHDELQARWRSLVPFCSPTNPVDVTAQLINTPELFVEFARDMVMSDQIDVLAVFLPQAHPGDVRTRALIDVARLAADRGVAIAVVGAVTPDAAVGMHDAGIATFIEPTEAAATLARLRLGPPPSEAVRTRARDVSGARLAPPADGSRITDEVTVKAVLSAYGVEVVRDIKAHDRSSAVEAARQVGFPVVLKRQVPGVAHKALAGGVVVGIDDEAAMTRAADRLLSGAPGRRAKDDPAPTPELLVEPMILGDELFVSVTRDPIWGALALVGVGGGAVEDAEAIAFRGLPLQAGDVASMLAESPSLAPLFTRGRRVDAIGTLAATFDILEILLDLSPKISAIELNPVMVRPDGRCIVVDALVEWR